jgi:hypothetical protein
MSETTEREAQLIRCITMAMGCLDPDSPSIDESLAWWRLSDALAGREPRAGIYDLRAAPLVARFSRSQPLPNPPHLDRGTPDAG